MTIIRNMLMPEPASGQRVERRLKSLGGRIKARRKALGISATATAESVGISRVTLHRIERGEASVTMGAYLSVIWALGLTVELHVGLGEVISNTQQSTVKKLPQSIALSSYPQLKRLAWHIRETEQISPKEALELYERNWRHVDLASMQEEEQQLILQLLKTFGRERILV